MRTYDILYVKSTNSWSIIFKDDTDQSWSVFAEGMDEAAARMMLRGAERD